MNLRTKKKISDTIYYVFILLACFVMIYPLLWMFSASFKETKDVMTTANELIPKNPTLQNYVAAWKGIGRTSFLQFFRNSMLISVVRVIGTVLSASLTAFAFARINFKGRKFWFAMMIGTMALPGMVLTIPNYLIWKKIGLVGTYWPMFLGSFLGGGAFNVFMIMQFMKNINRSVDEAAVLDGCGWFQLYWHIILPLVKPALATVAVLTFIGAWGDFMSSLIYLNKPEMYPIAYALTLYKDESGTNYGPMMAMSIFSITPTLIMFFIFQKSLVEGISTSGVKG